MPVMLKDNKKNLFLDDLFFNRKERSKHKIKLYDDGLIRYKTIALPIKSSELLNRLAILKINMLRKVKSSFAEKSLLRLESENPKHMEIKERLGKLFFDSGQFYESAFIWFFLYVRTKNNVFLEYLIASTIDTKLFKLFFADMNICKFTNSVFLYRIIKFLLKKNHFINFENMIKKYNSNFLHNDDILDGSRKPLDNFESRHTNLNAKENFYTDNIKGNNFKNDFNTNNLNTNKIYDTGDIKGNDFSVKTIHSDDVDLNKNFELNYKKSLYLISNNKVYDGLILLMNLFNKKTIWELLEFCEKKQKIEILYVLYKKKLFFENSYKKVKENLFSDFRKILHVILIRKNINEFSKYIDLITNNANNILV